MLVLISLAAFLSTFLGGVFALQLKDRLHLILGFSAGAIIGVAFFDLLPEALELGSKTYEARNVTALVAFGFIVYMIIDRLVGFHSHSEADETNSRRGALGGASLSIHSFLDGVAIGLAFQVSTAVGVIVTTAVLLHDFSDGINTVNLVLKNTGDRKAAFKWLLVDATAPVVGVISTRFYTLDESSLGIVLALFCGFFLYIGASDLLPSSHQNHPKLLTTLLTVAGTAIMFAAIRLAGV